MLRVLVHTWLVVEIYNGYNVRTTDTGHNTITMRPPTSLMVRACSVIVYTVHQAVIYVDFCQFSEGRNNSQVFCPQQASRILKSRYQVNLMFLLLSIYIYIYIIYIYIYIFFSHPIHYLRTSSLSPSNSDPGSHSRLFSPLPTWWCWIPGTMSEIEYDTDNDNRVWYDTGNDNLVRYDTDNDNLVRYDTDIRII